MNARVLLCVDLSNQAYKASAAFSTLTSEMRFTGGLYGFLGAVAKAIKITGATDLVVCEDRKPYLRSETYPQYKQLRAETKDPVLAENARYTILLIKDLLEITGWPLWSIPGIESDDLIAHATIKYRHRYHRIIGMSNDSDLFQLFQYDCFQVYRGKKGLYTRKDYDEEWLGLPPELFCTALAFTGTHNEVEGVRGIGPATARDIVSHPFKLRQAREKHQAIVERNLKLIHLPHPGLPFTTQIPPYSRPYKERELLRFCSRFDISPTMEMCQSFLQLGTYAR